MKRNHLTVLLLIAFSGALAQGVSAQATSGNRGGAGSVSGTPTRNTGGTTPGPCGSGAGSGDTGGTTSNGGGRSSYGCPAPTRASVGLNTAASAGERRPSTLAASTIGSLPYALTATSTSLAATSWQLWWNYNKDAHLDLRQRMTAGVITGSDTFFLGYGDKSQVKDLRRPTREQIEMQVVPALTKALSEERDNEILRCSMVALAKIGRTPDSDLIRSLHLFLDHGSQAVAEAAVLSLGILAREAAVPTLVSILEDDREGWKLVGRVGVPDRMRAFAAYALGLVAAQATDLGFQREVVARLIGVLNEPHFASRDIKVAAMTALGQTPLPLESTHAEEVADGAATAGGVATRQDQIEFLANYFDPRNERANRSTRHRLVRAHAPTAMARLLEGMPNAAKRPVIELLLEGCGQHSKETQEVQQSCVVALGQLGDADGDDPLDARIRTELVRTVHAGDYMSRRFALIALAQVGSRRGQGTQPWAGLQSTRSELLGQLARGQSQLRPWAGLALGVLGSALHAQGRPQEDAVIRALRVSCADSRRPDDCGAYMIALGLHRDIAFKDELLEKLDFFAGSDSTRGDAVVALGLMDERGAIAPIQKMLNESTYRPQFLRQAAIALGLLGDRQLVPELIRTMAAGRTSSVQGTVASALGAIGDARSITPLVELFENDRMTDSARAWAAVALGRICDPEELPWNAMLSADFNYNASPVTLTEQSSATGVLNIF